MATKKTTKKPTKKIKTKAKPVLTPDTEEYMFAKDLTKLLGVSKSNIDFFVNKGAPKCVPGKGYPVSEFCKFVIARPKHSNDRSNVRQLAEEYLLKKNKLNVNDKKKPTTSKKPSKVKKQEVGMVNALERARQVEVTAYQLYAESLEATGVISTSSLEAWQRTLDILRKCETDFGKVLERNKTLIDVKEVQDFFEPRIEQVKTILLNLPAKLAPSLEGLPWHEIQKRLEQEVRDAITKLSNFK